VEKLLQKGAKPSHANNLPLKLASIQGFTDIVSKLLDYDVNPNAEDTDIIDTKFLNHTALMLAAEKGHADTVQVLLAKGADPNIRHEDGYTALTLASCNNAPHTDVINVLLEHGADPDVLPKDQYSSALFCATRSGNEDLVKTLLDKHADPNIQGLYDRTPLMWAANKGYTKIVQMLLENGAKVNITTNNKETALSFAQRGEQEANRDTIVKMLQLYNPASRRSWSLPSLPHIFQPRQVLQHELPTIPGSNKAYLPTRKNYRKMKRRSKYRRRR
jgi:ankyrin repeat protein